jgi:transcriptional regulator with XRE-family HTH domain
MSGRSALISKLKKNRDTREGYVRAKLGTLVPSQIRALRLKSDMRRQKDLADAADILQSRISMIETPGAANVTLETLARLAAVFEVGLIVKFVSFSEMLHWENTFSQDRFDVVRLKEDVAFCTPTVPYQRDETVAATEDVAGVNSYSLEQHTQYDGTEGYIIKCMPIRY